MSHVDLGQVDGAHHSRLYVVVLRDSDPPMIWGTFRTELEAKAFAEVVGDAVDPCLVRPLCSPIAELVGAYREASAR